MIRILAIILGLCLGAASFADESASIEFQQRAKALGQSISSDNARQSERCAELRRQMEATKGPQRHTTARQAYEEECVQDYSAPASPGLSIGN